MSSSPFGPSPGPDPAAVHPTLPTFQMPEAERRNGTDDTVDYRPRHRPGLAWLGILDDGSDHGEWVRIRQDRVTIGRTEGDVVIPFDNLISSRHAELYRSSYQGRVHWTLRDLQSTNGTYAWVLDAALDPGQHLLLGGGHFRFDDPLAEAGTEESKVLREDDVEPTRKGLGDDGGILLPSLVELTSQGEGRRFVLERSENVVGRDPERCRVVLADDRMVSPQHARIFRDEKGIWRVADLGSRNGVWLRVRKVRFKRTSYFQLGEQRFVFKMA